MNKILFLLEDNIEISKLIQRRVGSAAFEIYSARNNVEGVKVARNIEKAIKKNNGISIIALIDLQLPKNTADQKKWMIY